MVGKLRYFVFLIFLMNVFVLYGQIKANDHTVIVEDREVGSNFNEEELKKRSEERHNKILNSFDLARDFLKENKTCISVVECENLLQEVNNLIDFYKNKNHEARRADDEKKSIIDAQNEEFKRKGINYITRYDKTFEINTKDYLRYLEARKKTFELKLERLDYAKKKASGEVGFSTTDFWNGNESKGGDQKTADNNFWNGNEKKTNSSSSYWDTATTIDDQIEALKKVAEKSGDQYIGEKVVKDKTVVVKYRDHGEVDGDRINIYHNDQLIRSNVTLSSRFSSVTVRLKHGINKIMFKALNEGSAGNNTATFEVTDNKGESLYANEWNIKTGFKGILLIIKI